MLFFGIIIGFLLAYFLKTHKPKKNDSRILKETQKFRYVFKDHETIVFVKDQYEFENKVVPIKRSSVVKSNGLDYERVQELKSRKIESKYFYPITDLDDESNFFFGKKIVITGEFDLFPDRNEVAKLFWNVGADIDTGIGKNTEFLIVGLDYGPKKMQKAIENGISIIDQDRLSEYFNEILD